MYLITEHLRGVWGLSDRAYTDEEIAASPHLQAAVRAGALVCVDGGKPGKPTPRRVVTIDPQQEKEGG